MHTTVIEMHNDMLYHTRAVIRVDFGVPCTFLGITLALAGTQVQLSAVLADLTITFYVKK